MIRLTCAMLFGLAATTPVAAMVGGAPPSSGDIAAAVVTIVGPRGFCSGALIAPDIVLTAAHCVSSGADLKIVRYDAQRQPTLLDLRRVVTHPQFKPASIDAHRASADIALLQLATPLAASPLSLGTPVEPFATGRSFQVVGVGVAVRGDGKSGGTPRSASLIATGKPGRLQIRLVDPATNNVSAGLGACTGDSGAPVLESRNGRPILVGVVSWTTAAGNAAGCGGLTGVTPLTLYRDWIVTTARAWGAEF